MLFLTSKAAPTDHVKWIGFKKKATVIFNQSLDGYMHTVKMTITTHQYTTELEIKKLPLLAFKYW